MSGSDCVGREGRSIWAKWRRSVRLRSPSISMRSRVGWPRPDRIGPAALSRGAYGAHEGAPRILRLLDELAIPATFFVPGDTAKDMRTIVERIVGAGHEVGHHGHVHEPPQCLTPKEERETLERGLEALAQHSVRPVGYRSPGGEVSDATFPLLLEFGFRYDSSLVGRDTPYWVGSRWIAVRVWSKYRSPGSLTNSAHFLFSFGPTYMVGMSAPSKVEEIWRGEFDGCSTRKA